MQTVWVTTCVSWCFRPCNWLGWLQCTPMMRLLALNFFERSCGVKTESHFFARNLEFVLSLSRPLAPPFMLYSWSLYTLEWIRVAKQIGSWSFDEIWFDYLTIWKLSKLSKIIPFLYQSCLIRFGIDISAYFDWDPVQKSNQNISLLLFTNYLI